MQHGRNLYEILQVDPRAEPEVLEAAFRRLARKYHPDVSGTEGDGRMKEINAAYQVLRDPKQRAEYDSLVLEPNGFSTGNGSPAASEPEQSMQTWLTCRQHTSEPAVATCPSCGAGLCERCFARFQPARCLTCTVEWAREPRRRFLLPALWFFIALGAMAFLVANSAWLIAHRSP